MQIEAGDEQSRLLEAKDAGDHADRGSWQSWSGKSTAGIWPDQVSPIVRKRILQW
jgi:hypothetical protein